MRPHERGRTYVRFLPVVDRKEIGNEAWLILYADGRVTQNMLSRKKAHAMAAIALAIPGHATPTAVIRVTNYLMEGNSL